MKHLPIVALFAALPWAVPAQVGDVGDEAAFQAFLEEVRVEALERGIGAATLDEILPTISLRRRVIAADRSQAEFVDTYERYLRRVSPQRIAAGRRMLEQHGDMISRVAAEYGVQPRFIVSILGLESDYGAFPITEPLFDVVATLAFDRRRAAQFRNELFAALEIVDAGHATFDMMKSSWAGALGVPQFSPSIFLSIAVDHDGDGRIDLWNFGPDVVASVANYLRDAAWRDDQTWGRVVRMPAGGDASLAVPPGGGLSPEGVCRRYRTLGPWHPLDAWQAAGLRREDGSNLPARNLPAALITGDPGDGRGYLVYRNFCAIMSYNPAFRYAIAVGLLADAIGEADARR
jgi:membrane-bound lytic murein transglycosylase B